MKLSRTFEFFIVVALSLFFTYAYWRYQPQIIAGNGRGWDGIAYHQLYSFYSGLPVDADVTHPFCKRIGLPFLATLFPLQPTSSFRYLNIVFGFLSISICYLALRARFSFSVSLAAVVPLCSYLFSPIRFSNFYPYFVDPPALFLFAVCLATLIRKRYYSAFAILLFSAVFRESGLYYALALSGALYFAKEISLKKTAFFFGIVVIVAFSIIFLYFGPCEGSQITVATSTALAKMGSFAGLLKIIAALSLTLGPFILVNSKLEIKTYEPIVLVSIVFLILSIVMSSFGGYDTTRIFFSAYPLYVFYLCSLIQDVAKARIIFFAIAGMIANSFAMKIPEPEHYWPNNEIAGFFSLFPDYGHIAISAGIIAYWASCLLIARLIKWGQPAVCSDTK